MTARERNWADTYTYTAETVHRPRTLDDARRIVAETRRIRALGSRHSFNDLADSPGDLITLEGLPADVQIDAAASTVTVNAAVRYGDLAEQLHAAGHGLHAMASLPHISVAGAVATATHGSGDTTKCLSAAVVALELITADGELLRLRRGDPEFAGAVVNLGALGVVSRVTLEIEPTYEVRQHVFNDVPWDTVLANFDAVTSAAHSVSLFGLWRPEVVDQVWLKSRDAEPRELFGATPAPGKQHPILGLDPVNCTEQGGVPGPWFDRLPHFRMGFTPSVGEEIQSEYLVPRSAAVDAIEAVRRIGPRVSPLLQVTEIRTVAADDLWLSPSYEQDVVGIHFTLVRRPEEIRALLPLLSETLAPFGARPHWGKWFDLRADRIAELYPRLPDFLALAERLDPERCFRNDYLDRVLGG
jgi:xylitol oxidase